MRERMSLATLRAAHQTVLSGERLPYDFYDTDCRSLLARIGKRKLTFYAYIGRNKKQKMLSTTPEDLTMSQLKSLRERVGGIEAQYQEVNPQLHDHDTVDYYLRAIYRPVVSKGVFKEINRFSPRIKEKTINTLTAHDIQRWKKVGEGRGLSQETLRKMYYALHAMLEYAVRNRHISKHHISGVKFQIDRTTTIAKRLTDDQLDRLARVLGTCSKRDRVIALFTLMTGTRTSETLKLKLPDIYFENKQAWIQASGTKTKTGRYVELTTQLSDLLREYLEEEYIDNPEKFLFYNKRTQNRLKSFRKPWLKIRDYSLLEGIRFYDFRHTFCSTATSYADLQTVMKLMGHKNLSTTAKYLHLAPGSAAKAIKEMEEGMDLDRFK